MRILDILLGLSIFVGVDVEQKDLFMKRFIAEMKFKYRPQWLALRDFGHRITGNDRWIREYNDILMTMSYNVQYAEEIGHSAEEVERIRKARDIWSEEDIEFANGNILLFSGYNPYAARRAKNKKKVEEGRKLLKKFNLIMIKSREEER